VICPREAFSKEIAQPGFARRIGQDELSDCHFRMNHLPGYVFGDYLQRSPKVLVDRMVTSG
jgi:hypothetical protein